jgi:hypothetical protein
VISLTRRRKGPAANLSKLLQSIAPTLWAAMQRKFPVSISFRNKNCGRNARGHVRRVVMPLKSGLSKDTISKNVKA